MRELELVWYCNQSFDGVFRRMENFFVVFGEGYASDGKMEKGSERVGFYFWCLVRKDWGGVVSEQDGLVSCV